MMELIDIWEDLEKANQNGMRKLVCSDLLCRTYIGTIDSKRCLYIEFPDALTVQLNKLRDYEGLELLVKKTGYEQNGCTSLILLSGSEKQNDEFTIIAKDILTSLHGINDAKHYADKIFERISSWAEFFTARKEEKLSHNVEVGLFGELFCMKQQFEAGVTEADKWWNGPQKSAQDFQTKNVCLEVKTTTANELAKVHISDVGQLTLNEDHSGSRLFLAVYRLIPDNLKGMTLPELIDQVKGIIPEDRKSMFDASLGLVGYSDKLRDQYSDKFTAVERRVYEVKDDFPRLTRNVIPAAITDVKYVLYLNDCDKYLSDFSAIVDLLKD